MHRKRRQGAIRRKMAGAHDITLVVHPLKIVRRAIRDVAP
jgi:hypothetical protein